MSANGDRSLSCSKEQIFATAVDIIIVLIAALPLLLFKAVGSPFLRGFHCDDESIQYPYKDSTVTSPVLYGLGFSINIAVILIVEYVGTKCPGTEACIRRRSETTNSETGNGNATKQHIYKYFAAVFQVLLPFVFGAVMEHVTTDIAKYSVGRLRPHFISVCKPDPAKYNCADGYIENDVCTGDPQKIKEARLSFPSGHSSFSVYTMVFLMFYLQARLRWRALTLLRPFLQMIAFYLAYYCCLSRISDYKHHWSDVLAGAIIGAVAAVITVFRISNLFFDDEEFEKTNMHHKEREISRDTGASASSHPQRNTSIQHVYYTTSGDNENGGFRVPYESQQPVHHHHSINPERRSFEREVQRRNLDHSGSDFSDMAYHNRPTSSLSKLTTNL